ncbi:hypothetical protein KTJ90_11390 [Pantoea jilinensis]|nr:hypothetical protein KTJ90_11390 [Pantoea jilinensis]
MKKLKFKPTTGALVIDEKYLEITSEELFCKSELYKSLQRSGSIKSLMPHHYLIDSIIFHNKEFELRIRPICFNFPFMVQLVDKGSEYYHSLNDWNRRTDIEMLNESVRDLSKWLSSSLELGYPDFIETEVVRWGFPWGNVSVSYETRSFNHGIYIIWDAGL